MSFQLNGPCPLIEVFDMATSLWFYCDVLGFQVRSSSGPLPDCGWVWLDSGTAQLISTQCTTTISGRLFPNRNARVRIAIPACTSVAETWTVRTRTSLHMVLPSVRRKWLIMGCGSCTCKILMVMGCAFSEPRHSRSTTPPHNDTAGQRRRKMVAGGSAAE